MFSKKLLTLLVCGSLLGSTVLTGCSSASASDIQVVDTTVTGTVQAVDGDVVTVVINGMGNVGPQMQPGQSPSAATSKSGLANPAEAEGDIADFDESDKPMQKVGEGEEDFDEADKEIPKVGEEEGDFQDADVKFGKSGDLTIQITISDDVELKNAQGDAITLADIVVGNLITIVVDEDGKVVSVMVGEALTPKTTAEPKAAE